MRRQRLLLCAGILFLLLVPLVSSRAQEGPTVDPEFLAQIQATEEQVCELRDIFSCTEPGREWLNADQMISIIAAYWENDYTPQQAADEQLFYVAFGFMLPDIDLWDLMYRTGVIETPVRTFYDREQNQLMVLNTGDLRPFDEIVYAHVYSRFLLDEVYNLRELFPQETRDEALATAAVWNGDAQLITVLYTERLLQQRPDALNTLLNRTYLTGSPVGQLPPVIQAEVRFQYERGLEYVTQLWQQGGWSAVDVLYNFPPLSTEHILHPEVYRLYQPPRALTLRDSRSVLTSSGDTWRLVESQTMGEFYLRQHLSLFLPFSEVDQAASGWGGDRYNLYVRDMDRETALVWKLGWDTVDDAFEFRQQYAAFLNLWFEGSPSIEESGEICWEALNRTACLVQFNDTELLFTQAPTKDLALRLLQQQLNPRIFG